MKRILVEYRVHFFSQDIEAIFGEEKGSVLKVKHIIQVTPHVDYTVTVYFSDGKIVIYDVRPKLDQGVFKAL